MEIKILGSGCASCDKLEQATREAVAEAGLDATIEKVTDMAQIMSYGVMSTPALVVDGAVRVTGRVPDVGTITRILGDASASTGTGGCSCGGCC